MKVYWIYFVCASGYQWGLGIPDKNIHTERQQLVIAKDIHSVDFEKFESLLDLLEYAPQVERPAMEWKLLPAPDGPDDSSTDGPENSSRVEITKIEFVGEIESCWLGGDVAANKKNVIMEGYLLFMGENDHKALGGWRDYVGSYSSVIDAKTAADKKYPPLSKILDYAWAQIIDVAVEAAACTGHREPGNSSFTWSAGQLMSEDLIKPENKL